MIDRRHWLGSLGLALLIGSTSLQAVESVDALEARHSTSITSFETETRSELTRIARDKSLTGEEKILRVEAWFASQESRIAKINAMADSLDQLKPLPGKPRPAPRADPSPEGIAAAGIHSLNARLSKGEITTEEFDRLRKPHLDQLTVLREHTRPAGKKLPSPPFDDSLDAGSSEQEIAAALHAQCRYLASLPTQEAEDIRADKESPVNRLLLILDQRERMRFGEASETFDTPEDNQQKAKQRE